MQTFFPLTYPLASSFGYVTNGGINETLAIQGTGFDLAAYWLYWPSTNMIQRVLAGPPAAAVTCSISGTDTSCSSDPALSVVFQAGDKISIRAQGTADPDDAVMRWTARFDSSP